MRPVTYRKYVLNNYHRVSRDDSEGILYLNSRGLARAGSPLRAPPSGNPRLRFVKDGIPEESSLVLPIDIGYQKRFLRNRHGV